MTWTLLFHTLYFGLLFIKASRNEYDYESTMMADMDGETEGDLTLVFMEELVTLFLTTYCGDILLDHDYDPNVKDSYLSLCFKIEREPKVTKPEQV